MFTSIAIRFLASFGCPQWGWQLTLVFGLTNFATFSD